MPDDDLLTCTLLLDLWLGVEADLDHEREIAADDGCTALVAMVDQVLAEGLRQVPAAWRDAADRGDADAPATVAVALGREVWAWLAGVQREAMAVYDELADVESATMCRDTLAVVEAALGDARA